MIRKMFEITQESYTRYPLDSYVSIESASSPSAGEKVKQLRVSGTPRPRNFLSKGLDWVANLFGHIRDSQVEDMTITCGNVVVLYNKELKGPEIFHVDRISKILMHGNVDLNKLCLESVYNNKKGPYVVTSMWFKKAVFKSYKEKGNKIDPVSMCSDILVAAFLAEFDIYGEFPDEDSWVAAMNTLYTIIGDDTDKNGMHIEFK